MGGERDSRAVWLSCRRFLSGPPPDEQTAHATLTALAERARTDEVFDRYGGGPLAERLEARICELLGTEGAVWMPSGTMAQQIALRIHCSRRGSAVVAFHPQCHLDTHEERGYERLHGLHAAHLGSRERLVTADDVAGLREQAGAVLLELPQRDLGGLLPSWDDLVAVTSAAREHGAALHLDGARLWQCEPHFGRSLAEISGLFDTVYVSFYKDLRAPAGCALAGPADVIDEARVWQIRHGGRMFRTFPYLLAAERGLDEILPRMPAYVAHAQALATALTAVDGLAIAPDPPQAAMFHLHARGDATALAAAALEIAERSGAWLGDGWGQSEVPGIASLELSIGEAALAIEPAEAAALYAELLALA